MSNLAKIENKPTGLTKREFNILSVYKNNKVAKIERKDVKKAILASIGKAIFISGQGKGLESGEINLMADEFYDILITKYMRLSVDEILPIFYSGALGEYGEYHGINLKTFRIWVDTYLKTDRIEALKKEKQEVFEKQEPTEQEKKNIKMDFLRDCLFNHISDFLLQYQSNNFKIKNEPYIYDFLDKNELIELDIEQKKLISEKTKERLLKEYERPSKDLEDRRKKSEKLKKLLDNKLEFSDFKSECKRTALREWLKKEMIKGTDIEKLITDKINASN